MDDLIKYIWFTMVAFTMFGLLTLVPVGRYQKAYLDELHRIKMEPQERVNATYKYVEAVESGVEDVSKGILGAPPKKYFEQSIATTQSKTQKSKKYSRPLYIRDKNNPRILYPVKAD
jgi:hypothetical protein